MKKFLLTVFFSLLFFVCLASKSYAATATITLSPESPLPPGGKDLTINIDAKGFGGFYLLVGVTGHEQNLSFTVDSNGCKRGDGSKQVYPVFDCSVTDSSQQAWEAKIVRIKGLPNGSYSVRLSDLKSYIATANFEIQAPTPAPTIPPPPCKQVDKVWICTTAFGDIQTDASGFIKSFFGVILSLAGGIAIILIMISGYRLMASQGNPEKVQAAREQLTSAIVGLLFIIFSVTILQIIGVDILHIPGFTK